MLRRLAFPSSSKLHREACPRRQARIVQGRGNSRFSWREPRVRETNQLARVPAQRCIRQGRVDQEFLGPNNQGRPHTFGLCSPLQESALACPTEPLTDYHLSRVQN